MARLLGHRQTKGAATDEARPTATAPHLDSTDRHRFLRRSRLTEAVVRVNSIKRAGHKRVQVKGGFWRLTAVEPQTW